MSRAIVSIVLSVCLAVVGGAKADEAPTSSSGTPIWWLDAVARVHRDFYDWAEREAIAEELGVEYAEAWRTRADFLWTIDALERTLARLPFERAHQEKIALVRASIASEPLGLNREPAAAPTLVPSPGCEAAAQIGLGRASWRQPAATDDAIDTWFRFSPVDAGWFRVSMESSQGDTSLAVFEACSGKPIATNDDAAGLDSVLVFQSARETGVWLRVRVRTPADGLTATMTVQRAGSAELSGLVREEFTGILLSGIRVDLYRSDGSFWSIDFTSPNGQYSFSGLPDDDYFLFTSNSFDHFDELWDDIPCEDGCTPTSGDPVTVAAGFPATADFELSPGATITGRMLGSDGPPVSGRVELANAVGSVIRWDTAGEDGVYRFAGREAGTYFVNTDIFADYRNEVWDDIPCDGNCVPGNGHPIVLEDEEQRVGIDFVLQKQGTISGFLTASDTGLPIQGGVDIYYLGGGFADFTFTNEFGYWVSRGLSEGLYRVATDLSSGFRDEVFDDIPCSPQCDLDQGELVEVAEGEETTGIDFALDRLGSISGRVTDSEFGFPLPSTNVRLYTESGAFQDSDFTSPTGYFEFTDLHPATYFVVAGGGNGYIGELHADLPCPGGAPQGCDPTTGTPIAVSLGEHVESIDLALSLGGTILGRVLDEITGEPMNFTTLIATSLAPAALHVSSTDSDGIFVFDELPTATYFVRTSGGGHFDELWDDLPCEPGCNPADGTPIEVELGETVTDVDFELILQGGISGLVRDDAGLPLVGITIDAWNSTSEIVASDATNADGIYQVNLSSGLFYLSTDNPLGLPEELWDDVPCPNGAAGSGLCDPLTGDSILVIGGETVLTGFDIVLGLTIFADGFESGDTSAWSTAVP